MKTKTVKCEECKHLIEEGDAQVVHFQDIAGHKQAEKHYYCLLHRKMYDVHEVLFPSLGSNLYGLNCYYRKKVMCDKNGELFEVLRVKETWAAPGEIVVTKRKEDAYDPFITIMILICISCVMFPLGLWVGVSM